VKISLVTIGKTKQAFVKEGLQFYQKRLKRYTSYNIVEIPEVKGAAKMDRTTLKAKESSNLLGSLPDNAILVALDEHGKSFRSMDFAKFLQQMMNQSTKHLVFAVGGAYGHDDALLKKAHTKVSLSDMTFPHDLIRLIFTEQLYRAFAILKNEPYHHE